MDKGFFRTTLFGTLFSAEFRRYAYGILGAEAVAVLSRCFSPVVQRYLIDAATAGKTDETLVCIVFLALLLAGVFALETAVDWLCGKLHIAARQYLKGEFFRHLLALPEDFLRSRGAGYFFNRIQNDIGEVIVFWRGGGILLAGDVLKLLIAWGTIAFFSVKCAFFVLPFLLIQARICFLFRSRQYRLSHRMQECVASERYRMQDFLTHHTAVKTHVAQENASVQVTSGLSRWGKLASKRLLNESFFRSCLQLPVWLCTGTIAVAGLLLVAQQRVSLGEVWALISLSLLLFSPARSLGNVFVQMESARSAWSRLQEIRRRQGEASAPGGSDCRLTGDLVLDGVSFGYGKNQDILQNISFRLPAGSLLFLRGANGSGKSTLLALILRLYESYSGTIMIGGHSIADFPLGSYRSRIGYIGQHPDFVKGTVRDNLRLGNETLADEVMTRLLKELGFWKILAGRGGLDAEVKENGSNFSGGEKLRLAFAREMLRDIDLLLLDEPAAHLDEEGRVQFYRLIQDLHGKKSVLAAVHGDAMPETGKSFRLPEKTRPAPTSNGGAEC